MDRSTNKNLDNQQSKLLLCSFVLSVCLNPAQVVLHSPALSRRGDGFRENDSLESLSCQLFIYKS